MKRLVAWTKQNPLMAALFAIGAMIVLALVVVIVTLVSRASGPSRKDLSALEQEPNMAKRVRKLVEMEAPSGHPSARYREAMGALFEALTHSEALPEDITALARVAGEAGSVDNDEFAWWVAIETRLRRGAWPHYPEPPPKDPRVRTLLRDKLKNSRVIVQLPKDLALQEAWLRVAVEGHELEKNPKAPIGPLLGEFYKDKDTQDNQLALYQQLVPLGARAEWLAKKLYDAMGLLPELIYVSEQEPIPGPMVVRGPENTLLFVGALEGDRCAVAAEQKPLPPLWVRSCKGLQPRRLQRGELFLIGVDTKYDAAGPVHWLPVLAGDDGQVTMGEPLSAQLDARVLASFIVAAPRFVLDGRGFRAFAPPLGLVSATVGTSTVPSFRTAAAGRAPLPLMGFSATAKAKWQTRGCGKVDKDRCDPLRGPGADRHCDIAPAVCIELPSGAMVRWAKTQIVRTELCMHDFGQKADCKFAVTTGAFVDTKAAHATEFVDGAHVTLFDRPADADSSAD